MRDQEEARLHREPAGGIDGWRCFIGRIRLFLLNGTENEKYSVHEIITHRQA